jgi:hypothetical protein
MLSYLPSDDEIHDTLIERKKECRYGYDSQTNRIDSLQQLTEIDSSISDSLKVVQISNNV